MILAWSANSFEDAYLAFVKDFLRYFAFKRFWWLRLLQDLVLTEREEVF